MTNTKHEFVGSTYDPATAPPIDSMDSMEWFYGGHAPTGRMGGFAKLARLLQHTYLTGIDGRTVELWTGVAMDNLAAAFRDGRVIKAAEARGWRKVSRMGPRGSMRNYLIREQPDDGVANSAATNES